jgi:Na+-driven multidrug efflux pump
MCREFHECTVFQGHNDTIVINYSNITSFVGFMHIIALIIQIHYASDMHIVLIGIYQLVSI